MLMSVCSILLWSSLVTQGLASPFRMTDGNAHAQSAPRKELPPISSKYLPPPIDDPWYKAPEGWADHPPGTALKVRKHAYPTINIKHCADTWQVLFRSSNTHGAATWAVTTVFIPETHTNCSASHPEKCAHGIVSYQLASDSVWPNACPSYLLQARDPWGELRDMLAEGWILIAPDYEGPDAAFCTGKQTGYITLDNMRAVLNISDQLGMQRDKIKLGMWGYSGGAAATEFAIEMAEHYAPELKIDAAVVGGQTLNMTTVNQRINKNPAAGLVISSLLGITMQYPEGREYLLSRIKETGPMNRTAFLDVEQMTGLDALTIYYKKDIYDFFIDGEADMLHPMIQKIVDVDAVMGLHGTPKMPTFYYKAIEDEMSPASETDALLERFCNEGANILYHRNSEGDHNTEWWTGRKRMIAYLSVYLDGSKRLEVPATGCMTVNVSYPWDPTGMWPEWITSPIGPDGWPVDDDMHDWKLPQSAFLKLPPH